MVLQHDQPQQTLLAKTDQQTREKQTFLPVNVQSLSVRDVQPSTTKHTVMYSTIDQPSYKKPVTLPMSQQSNRQVEPVYSCYAKTSVTIDGTWDSP